MITTTKLKNYVTKAIVEGQFSRAQLQLMYIYHNLSNALYLLITVTIVNPYPCKSELHFTSMSSTERHSCFIQTCYFKQWSLLNVKLTIRCGKGNINMLNNKFTRMVRVTFEFHLHF